MALLVAVPLREISRGGGVEGDRVDLGGHLLETLQVDSPALAKVGDVLVDAVELLFDLGGHRLRAFVEGLGLLEGLGSGLGESVHRGHEVGRIHGARLDRGARVVGAGAAGHGLGGDIRQIAPVPKEHACDEKVRQPCLGVKHIVGDSNVLSSPVGARESSQAEAEGVDDLSVARMQGELVPDGSCEHRAAALVHWVAVLVEPGRHAVVVAGISHELRVVIASSRIYFWTAASCNAAGTAK